MVTAEQNLANLGSAANLAAFELGLDLIPPGAWTQAARIEYIARLAQKIVTYSDQFSAASVAAARSTLGDNLSGMAIDTYVFQHPDGADTLAGVFVNTGIDTALAMTSQLANLGTGALALISKTGAVLANTGTAAENFTASASNSTFVFVGVLLIGALLILKTERRISSALS